jgi:hypothetical protein
MLDLKINPASVDSTIEHMQAVKQRIFEAVREGMAEGMNLLAENTVQALEGSGVQSRTGALESNILSSPRVAETEFMIMGRVTAMAPVKARGGQMYYTNLRNILNRGFHEPAQKSPVHQIVEAGSDTFWARGHVAFDVRAHPFYRQAVEISESPIMDLIRERVAAAAEE